MPHRPRARRSTRPSSSLVLDGMLTVLERGVHVLPIRGPNEGVYLVACDDWGQAVCDTPVCVALDGAGDAVRTLRQRLDGEHPAEGGLAAVADASLVADVLDRALFGPPPARVPPRLAPPPGPIC